MVFLLAEEKEEKDKLNLLEENVTAEREIYIAKDQQIAMEMDRDDEASV